MRAPDPLLRDCLLSYLKNHCLGGKNAAKASVLAEQFSLTIREVNDAVRDLRQSGIIVGSLKKPPFGYFIPVTEDEVHDCLNAFKGEVFDMLHTYNILKRSCKAALEERQYRTDLFKVEEASGQMELNLCGTR